MIRVSQRPGSEPGRIAWRVRTDHDVDHLLVLETLAGEPPPVPDRLDTAALAVVTRAMNFRQDLHLEGPVSWSLLAGLEEWMDTWVTWLPELYGTIAITAEEVVDDRGDGLGSLGDAAVVAFSGGVDGTYAAWAHQAGQLGHRSRRLAGAVLVQGFDIPVEDDDGFALAVRSAQAILDELGVPLVAVRTNWRDVCVDWQMSFGIALASVLHHFTDRAGAGIIAADSSYSTFHLPWGTNPVSQPMLASRRFALLDAGGALGRTAKCAAIGSLASVRDGIRVCWAGDQLGRNCGRCEKCVRTKLNFLAAGIGPIPALGPIRPGEVSAIQIGSVTALRLYDELLDALDAYPAGVADELVALVARERARLHRPDR